MPTLKESLGGMTAINQFLVWKLTWDNAENKYKKVPVNINSPEVPVSSADPVNWLSYDAAHSWVSTHVGYTTGFYFNDTCGFWFLDVDTAIIDGQWTPVALDLYGMLQGACFEWSSSSRGYHMFGRGTVPVSRKIKPTGSGLELYTEGRGVAFGVTGEALGSADTDCTQQITAVVNKYFALSEDEKIASESDFSNPREDWYSECTDEELLQRMLRSESLESKFNIKKPIFSDFWNNNVAILAGYYGEDESSYDAGLASQLAFWTGCHAPRMKQFMLQSGLKRDKYNRRDYLDRTINFACGKCITVLKDKPTPVEDPSVIPDDANYYLGVDQQRKLFKDCVWIRSHNQIYRPIENGAFELLDMSTFNALFGEYKFKLSNDNGQGATTKKAWEAFTGSNIWKFPKAAMIKFNPTKPPKLIYIEDGVPIVNSYDPIYIHRCEGDVSLFTNLVRKNFPNGNDAEILISWMAACVQHPGQKFMWAPVLQGGQGIGKTTITECLKYAVGRQFTVTPKASELGAKFNAWIERALLVVINEMKQDKETEGEVKKLVTDTDVIVEAKGRDQHMARNYANFIFTLNDKWDFKKSKGDRRFCVMYSALQELDDIAAAGLTEEHFNMMHEWLNHQSGYAMVTQYLADYRIKDQFNPAKGCLRAPDSSSEAEVYENSIHHVESTLREAVADERIGFKGGFISLKHAVELFDGKKDPRLFRKFLLNMGYSVHPNLSTTNGQLTKVLIEDGAMRIRVYCSKELIKNTKDLSGNDLTELYRKSQYSSFHNVEYSYTLKQ